MSQREVIDGLRFARGALERRGFLGMARLQRLAQMPCSSEGVNYRLRGGITDDGEPYIRVSARGTLRLVCQRCLGTILLPLALETELRLNGSLREIAAANDEFDRVLASRNMDVAELVEDEVILALPMAPRHERCAAADSGAAKKSSPFEVLAGLKRSGDG